MAFFFSLDEQKDLIYFVLLRCLSLSVVQATFCRLKLLHFYSALEKLYLEVLKAHEQEYVSAAGNHTNQ